MTLKWSCGSGRNASRTVRKDRKEEMQENVLTSSWQFHEEVDVEVVVLIALGRNLREKTEYECSLFSHGPSRYCLEGAT